jgi:hypothetical protein
MIAAEMANLPHGTNRFSKMDASIDASISQPEAAKRGDRGLETERSSETSAARATKQTECGEAGWPGCGTTARSRARRDWVTR